MMSKREKIKAMKISDVLLSNDTSEAQGFLQNDGDSCAIVAFVDEEEEEVMLGTGIHGL